jgi:Holliday junction resolvase RusA-like endonuclease
MPARKPTIDSLTWSDPARWIIRWFPGSISIACPMPPSKNRLHVIYRGRMRLSQEARRWRECAMIHLRPHCPHDKLVPPLQYRIILTEPDERRRDGQNLEELILDVLAEIGLYDNDKLFDKGVWVRDPVRGPLRIAIELSEVRHG